jgi:hypothetical protein
MFRRGRAASFTNTAPLPAHAEAVARRLARLAAEGRPVAPATFANNSREGYVCVYAERAGGVRMVAHIATKKGRREWRAEVSEDGTLDAWAPVRVPVTRVVDVESALRLSPA